MGIPIADSYFNNCAEIAAHVPDLMGKRVRYNFFVRENGITVGSNRSVNFAKENTYGPLSILGLRDGDEFKSGEPVLIVEGNFYELVNLETTMLGFLSYSGAASSMREIVQAAEGVPVIDMSARHYPWQVIEEAALAAYLGGAVGTSTEAGYRYVQKWYNPGDKFRCFGSIPHALAAATAEMAEQEGLFPSVMAAKLFHQVFPEKPLTVLVDYEGRELDVANQAYEVFGDKLFAVRLDTHGGRQHQGTVNIEGGNPAELPDYFYRETGTDIDTLVWKFAAKEECPSLDVVKYLCGKGVTVEATFVMRDFLDSMGAKNTKIVVSSGFNRQKVAAFTHARAPMDMIGTGSWIRFAMFTADITHVWEDGGWKHRGKVGRTHGSGENLPVLYERR